jgi:hypothetical protein
MSVRRSVHFNRRGVVLAVCAAFSLNTAPTAGARAYEPPPPGNLIVNWGFDAGTSGWGSFGGTVSRTENSRSPAWCAPNAGAATITQQTGSVYTISDSQGGSQPTVRSTVAGETFIAYASVFAASGSAAGKPARIIIRERVGATGTIIKETSTTFTMPPANEGARPMVAATAVRSGSTMGLRIEQSNAQPGDAFSVDNVFMRRATRVFGSETPGTIWTTTSSDVSRVSIYSALGPNGYPDDSDRYLDRLRVYIDGRGGATGSQKLRAIIYEGSGPNLFDVHIVRASREVTISSGTSARWVDFRFDPPTPVLLGGWDGATYEFGLLSGLIRNVARYASARQSGALWWAPDTYADGPNAFFGTTDPDGHSPAWSTDDKQMSIQGIAAPTGPNHPESCWN